MSSNPFPPYQQQQYQQQPYQQQQYQQQPSPEYAQAQPYQSQDFISKMSTPQNLKALIGAIVVGLVFLFIIGSFIFGSGGSSKTIVFKENENREFLFKKAERGNAEAMYKYWIRCKDQKENVKWLKKSAEKGYARAQFYLGVAYTDGAFGIEADSDPSKKWLTKASKKGFPMAKVFCLYKGIGVEPDKDKAWKELEKGARAGFVENQMALAMFYLDTTPETPTAISLLTVDDRLLGLRPFNFSDKDKSDDKAKHWLEKAALNGYEPAQIALGVIYASEDKDKESVKWFEKAAVQGNNGAQCYVGACYKEGIGVEENKSLAKKWFKLSAAQGNDVAKSELDSLE